MRFLENSAEIFPQVNSDKETIDKHIERCARICYKSENLIKEGSATSFVQGMINRKHYAMLEHATIYLKLVIGSPVIDSETPKIAIKDFFLTNHFSRVKRIKYRTEEDAQNDLDALDFIRMKKCPCNVYYITTNYRVLIENDMVEKTQQYFCSCTENHVKRITVHFVTDRGVWNECIRHRELQRIDDTQFDIVVDYDTETVFSFAQESSRYCNYGRDKFGKELSFIYPDWANRDLCDFYLQKVNGNWLQNKILDYVIGDTPEKVWVQDMKKTEINYFRLIASGLKAEEARTVLNNSVKSELVMTGFDDETGWKHFFDLRYLGTTGKPQAEMKSLATELYGKFIENGFRTKDGNDE